MYSFEGVKKILETSIDSLVDNFVREPYIHRCEHSLHCELYTMLASHRALQGLYPIGSSGRKASLVHKEWPEPFTREGHTRRGNVDLAILSDKDLAHPLESSRENDVFPSNATNLSEIDIFTGGYLRPDFVVEIGLNYPFEHLESDYKKLLNSRYSKGNGNKEAYLVHLWQPHNTAALDDIKGIQSLILKADVNIAAVIFTKSEILIKHLSDKDLSPI